MRDRAELSTGKVTLVTAKGALRSPTVIVGVPDSGLVGTIACSYIVEQLRLEQIGYIDSDLMPPLLAVRNSVPEYPVHIFGGGDIAVVLSEVPLSQQLSLMVANEIGSWAKAERAGLLIGLTGMPSDTREEKPDEKPLVLGVTNDDSVLKRVKAAGIHSFDDGLIGGMHASLLKVCMSSGRSGLVLMGESLLQFPDPLAASEVVAAAARLLSLKLDVGPLLKESEEIRLRLRELMQQTTQAGQQQPTKAPGVYG